MSRLGKFALIPLLAACTQAPPPAPTPVPAAPPAAYGFTIEDEARVLMLEDRREFDPVFVDAWIHHENALHRARMAQALGRIGPHTFIDTKGNGARDPGERQAGVAQLVTLVDDPDPNVRINAAFALGQIGDASAVDALVRFANDRENAGVAAEAVEALSKLAANGTVPFTRYSEFTNASQREGVRARAVRYLFRFKSDEAMAVAASALESADPLMRHEGAYALSRRAYAPARAMLELLLTDPNTETRSFAAAALGRIAAPESIGALSEATQDPHPWVRINAATAISRTAAKDARALDRPQLATDAMRIVGLTEAPDPGTRAAAIDTLGWYATRHETSRKRLLEVAATGSRVEREIAAGVIAKQFNDEKLLPADLTNWARVRVLESGGTLANAMRQRWARDPDTVVRLNVFGSIGDADVDAQLPLITSGLDDPDTIVRATAIDRYGKAKSAGVARLRAAEERARRDAQNDARVAAIDALAEIDFPEREAFLRALLRDNDPMVRRIAADRIETKLKKPRPQFTPLPIARGAADYAEIVLWARQPHHATIRMTRGAIDIALLTQEAPMTTWNFAQLARRGYFNGTSFMRVVPNFVIQGGDPRNDMSGGPGYAIRDEINLQKYTRGAVGMALSGPDTGGSQFFITHSPQPHLDGGYTVFGRVTGGMDSVVDQVERGDRVETIAIDERKR